MVGGSRGGISFFNKSFKLKEKLKVSTNRITSITMATENGKQTAAHHISSLKFTILMKLSANPIVLTEK